MNDTTKQFRSLTIALGVTVLFNAVMLWGNLWRPYWWLGLMVNMALVVFLADGVARTIPKRWQRSYDLFLAIGFPVLLLAAWELIVRCDILNPRWFPPPSRIAVALWQLSTQVDKFSQTSLWGRPWLLPQRFATEGWSGVAAVFVEGHVWVTLMRVFVGFVLGAIPGVLLGMIMGMSRTIRTMLDTTMSAVYVLPKIAIFPIVMLMFANPFGEGPKIAVVAISAFFLVAINTMTGVRDIEPVYIQAARNYGANSWQLFRHVILPGAMPVIFAGMRLALGTALIVIVAIEFIRAKRGVGFLTFYYWEVMVTDKMYAGLFVIMLLGVLLTYGLQRLEKRIMPWR